MPSANFRVLMCNALVCALTSSLIACGGGGSGGGGSSSSSSSGSGGGNPPPPSLGFTVSANSITRAASVAGDEPLHASLLVTVTDTVAGQYGIRATYTTNGLSFATRTTLSTVTTELSLGFRSPTQTPLGAYSDTVRIGLCEDPACTIFKGTVLEIPVSYTVTTGTLPTVTIASNTVEISRLPWDNFTPPGARVVVTPAPRTRYFLSATTTHTSNGITSATYAQDAGDAGRIEIAFKPATQLSPGVYTDTINVRACIDPACAWPLVVTPSTITVNYHVTTTVPGPQGYTVRRSALPAADIAWSSQRNRLYASVPGSAVNYAGEVIVLDPVTEAVDGSVAVGFDPALLALADDESMLYVAERDGDSIRRFTTTPLTQDITISLGTDPYPPGTEELFASDMRVAPNLPRVLAVRRNNNLPGRGGLGIVIYDDSVMRPDVAQISPFSDWGFLAWDPDGTRLYASRAVLTVGPSGPAFASNLTNLNGRLHFVNGRIYSDEAQVRDPAPNGEWYFFYLSARAWAAAIDLPANRAYYAATAFAGDQPEIVVVNLTTREPIGRALLPPVAANVRPTRLWRYGVNGLAVVNSANELVFVHGALLQSP